jgi:hypothetical protein
VIFFSGQGDCIARILLRKLARFIACQPEENASESHKFSSRTRSFCATIFNSFVKNPVHFAGLECACIALTRALTLCTLSDAPARVTEKGNICRSSAQFFSNQIGFRCYLIMKKGEIADERY